MDFYNIAATLVGIAGLALAIDQSVRKRRAEKELSEIISRGSAPYLLADYMDARVNGEQRGNQIFRPGQETIGKISFETLDGLQLTHTYELTHGVCAFKRIDPK